MRNVKISTFVAGLSISLAGLAYFIWSDTKSELLLILAVLGFVIFLASVVMATRACLQWNELPKGT